MRAWLDSSDGGILFSSTRKTADLPAEPGQITRLKDGDQRGGSLASRQTATITFVVMQGAYLNLLLALGSRESPLSTNVSWMEWRVT